MRGRVSGLLLKILDRKRTKLKKAIQSPLKKKGQISISKYNTNEVRDQILAVGESFSHEQPNIFSVLSSYQSCGHMIQQSSGNSYLNLETGTLIYVFLLYSSLTHYPSRLKVENISNQSDFGSVKL
ncbi:hypothetical protein AXX17_AT3G40450 [Arabidopsis thaliana]|uniref:Uncharacterized protein n=1 Tax=Arabidopsis thaliana TaxID=3702 RepID=A0A178VPF8_ARATH|nr:hypothetical protein AXX17_AT3G40450 [Arabidopsis thaliana]